MEEDREGEQAGEAADRGKLYWWQAGFNPRDKRGVYPAPGDKGANKLQYIYVGIVF